VSDQDGLPDAQRRVGPEAGLEELARP
jgi:hypothetical protein